MAFAIREIGIRCGDNRLGISFPYGKSGISDDARLLEPDQHLALTRLRDGLVHKRQSIDSARSLQLIAFQEVSPSKG